MISILNQRVHRWSEICIRIMGNIMLKQTTESWRECDFTTLNINRETLCCVTSVMAITVNNGWLLTCKLLWLRKLESKSVRHKETKIEVQVSRSTSAASSLQSDLHSLNQTSLVILDLSIILCIMSVRLRSRSLGSLHVGFVRGRGGCRRLTSVNSDISVFCIPYLQLDCPTVWVPSKPDVCVVQILESKENIYLLLFRAFYHISLTI